MSNDKVLFRNSEGYPDVTAYEAMNRVQSEQDEADMRCQRLISAIKAMIDLSGYDLIARIELHDRRSGRNYR